ncbi:MAG: ATP synthase F1 subunit gamma [Verrucomicrobiia bacterium]|jgi:F-type H+-transporting ATPase subunit gamma
MASLRDIRRRIKGVKNIRQVTKAMNMIAAARLRRAQAKAESARPYAERLSEILQDVVASSGGAGRHPLMAQREVKSVALVLVTADRGLCGAFNAGIIREAHRFLIDQAVPVEIITVGRKGREHFLRLGYQIANHFPQPSREVRLEEVGNISKWITTDYGAAKYDQVYLAYAKFVSVLRSQPVVARLLPLGQPDQAAQGTKTAYQFEPGAEELLNTLLPQYIEVLVYRALVESLASEQAARMVAMKAATDSASDMITGLTREYNGARQGSITTALLEVVAGANALAEKE